MGLPPATGGHPSTSELTYMTCYAVGGRDRGGLLFDLYQTINDAAYVGQRWAEIHRHRKPCQRADESQFGEFLHLRITFLSPNACVSPTLNERVVAQGANRTRRKRTLSRGRSATGHLSKGFLSPVAGRQRKILAISDLRPERPRGVNRPSCRRARGFVSSLPRTPG